jgi:hypothetical protein
MATPGHSWRAASSTVTPTQIAAIVPRQVAAMTFQKTERHDERMPTTSMEKAA